MFLWHRNGTMGIATQMAVERRLAEKNIHRRDLTRAKNHRQGAGVES